MHERGAFYTCFTKEIILKQLFASGSVISIGNYTVREVLRGDFLENRVFFVKSAQNLVTNK